MAHDVFLSYSSGDKTVADATCAMLEQCAIRCWMAPRDILPGSDWGASIVAAITNSRVMILIFSAHSNTSSQVKREVQNATEAGIPILPVRIEDVSMSDTLKYFLGTQHWLDALTPPLEHHLEELAGTVGLLLSRDVENAIEKTMRPQPPSQGSPAITSQESAKRECSACGSALPPVLIQAVPYCAQCGTEYRTTEAVPSADLANVQNNGACPHCGSTSSPALISGAAYCSQCGIELNIRPASTEENEKGESGDTPCASCGSKDNISLGGVLYCSICGSALGK